MKLPDRLLHEIRSVVLVTLYFAAWLSILFLIKQLILAEYEIQVHGISKALIGALVLAKVVLVLDYVSLGAWVRRHAAWVDILLRTILYAFGVFLVLMLEKGFEGRAEFGGFVAAVRAAFAATDSYHLWVNTIVLSTALLVYNLLTVIRRYLGGRSLLGVLAVPLPAEDEETG